MKKEGLEKLIHTGHTESKENRGIDWINNDFVEMNGKTSTTLNDKKSKSYLKQQKTRSWEEP